MSVTHHEDAILCARQIVEQLDGHIVMGLPLGLGKPVEFTNAIYALARQDPSISLEIFTALTLDVPVAGSGLAGRFLKPLVDRLFQGVANLDYAADRRRGELPANVKVTEFYFAPGSQLGQAIAQHEYCSANYTHVCRELLDRGINLLATLVAAKDCPAGRRYSLSSNPDLTLDLAAHKRRDETMIIVGQVSPDMPFMPNDAEQEAAFFDHILVCPPPASRLFPALNRPVSLSDYATGLHVSSFIEDGGTLQIGIGSLGDAVVNALVQRQHHNAAYQTLLRGLIDQPRRALRRRIDIHANEFEQGLFGSSEMLVHSFAGLQEAGILKRMTYAHEGLQRAINRLGGVNTVSRSLLEELLSQGVVAEKLRSADVRFLSRFGFVHDGAKLQGELLKLESGREVPRDLTTPGSVESLLEDCSGQPLRNGVFLEAGFFLGPDGLYRWLRGLPDEVCAGINMTRISQVNQLYGDESLRREQRLKARMINEAMMVSLTGAVTSDALDSAQVVSGVGGQYNFVAMAHELDDARAIIMLPATRESAGGVRSNIVWNYGHTTIPRHLRDVVVTEFGAADLRGASDRDCIAAMLNIADSRFQNELLTQAKAAGKIEESYQIPVAYLQNLPDKLHQILLRVGQADWFPHFPWGTEMTCEESSLALALGVLKRQVGDWKSIARQLLRRLDPTAAGRFQAELDRMEMLTVKGLKWRVQRKLLLLALHDAHRDRRPLTGTTPKYAENAQYPTDEKPRSPH